MSVAERFLRSVRSDIAAKPPEHYNVNANLVNEADSLLTTADAVAGWGSGLGEVLDTFCALNSTSASIADLLTLESLDLTKRTLGTNACHGLSALVVLSTTLTELIVADNQLGDQGIAAIATALSGNAHTVLSALHLSRTHAGERAAKALLQMLATNTSLNKLDLRNNPDIDAEMRDKLEKACRAHMPPVRLIF